MNIKRALLVLGVWGWGLARGKADRAPSEPRKILVIQMAKLGDMVCTTPMFRALKERYPRAQVWVMGSRVNNALLEGNTDIDGHLVFGGIRSAIDQLRQERFDTALLAGAPDIASLAVAFFAGVPLIVAPDVRGGRSPLQDIWYRLALRHVVSRPHSRGSYAPREYLRLVEPLDIQTGDTTKHLAYTQAAKDKTAALLSPLRTEGTKLVGIAPGAGNKIKQWPPARFAALAEALARTGASVVIFGSARDRGEVGEMISHMSAQTPYLNLAEQLSIDELKAAIAHLDLFVAADTGPIYIAEAFGTPTVDIVGPVDEREQPPQADKHLVVVPPGPRVSELHVMNAKEYDYAEARRQAESTVVDSVLRACEQLLARHSSRP